MPRIRASFALILAVLLGCGPDSPEKGAATPGRRPRPAASDAAAPEKTDAAGRAGLSRFPPPPLPDESFDEKEKVWVAFPRGEPSGRWLFGRATVLGTRSDSKVDLDAADTPVPAAFLRRSGAAGGLLPGMPAIAAQPGEPAALGRVHSLSGERVTIATVDLAGKIERRVFSTGDVCSLVGDVPLSGAPVVVRRDEARLHATLVLTFGDTSWVLLSASGALRAFPARAVHPLDLSKIHRPETPVLALPVGADSPDLMPAAVLSSREGALLYRVNGREEQRTFETPFWAAVRSL
ncbi:MAG: hypothetical protein R6V85_18940 [Polyangia bacterium]